MLTLNLLPIPKSDIVERDAFHHQYVKPLQPVILTRFSETWPASRKWTFDYFKEKAGNVEVPLYGEAFANTGKSYMEPVARMRFAEYLDLIATDSTKLRMFLFNVFKHIPNLCDDFNFPAIMPLYLTKYPFLFFGGKGSYVDAHYDADLSHVFLTQFHGKRKIILFPPNDSVFLYRHPLTVSTNVDLGHPDFSHYPQLTHAHGYECMLEPHETLFIPSGYWHYIYYEEGGFGLSLRAPSISYLVRAIGLWNIAKLTLIDSNLSKLIGAQKWYDAKEKMAIKHAEKAASHFKK